MSIIRCPECGVIMQKIYGSKYETYYECIECGYGELREMSEYDSDDYLEELEDEYKEYEIDEDYREDIDEEDDFDF